MLFAALLVLFACGDSNTASTVSNSSENSESVSINESSYDEISSPNESSTSEESGTSESSISDNSDESEETSDESSTQEESSDVSSESSEQSGENSEAEESSTPEESQPEELLGDPLFDYGVPARYLDGYIYYMDEESGYTIGRVKPDGSDKTRYDKSLCMEPGYIHVLGDRLYYRSYPIALGNKLFSLSIDGSDFKCVSGDYEVNLCWGYPTIKPQDKLIFGNDPYYYEPDGTYYILSEDGTIQPIDYDDIPFTREADNSEWIYDYDVFLDHRLYKYRKDNKDEKIYLTDFNIWSYKRDGDKLYIMPDPDMSPDVHGIWSVNDDGTDLKQLCDDVTMLYYIIHGNYIYYSTLIPLGNHNFDHGAVYRMKTDGSEKQKISDENTELEYMINDLVVMVQHTSEKQEKLLILDKNDEIHVICETNTVPYPLCHIEKLVYYKVDTPEGHMVYSLDLETFKFEFFAKIGDRDKLLGDPLFDYGVPARYLDGYIYYMDEETGYTIGRVKPDGTDKARYSKDLYIDPWLIKILDDRVFYMDNNFKLYSMNGDGSDLKCLYDDKKVSIYSFEKSLNNRLFFITVDYKLYSMNSDGSDLKCLSGDLAADMYKCYPDITLKDKIVFGYIDDGSGYEYIIYYIANLDGSDVQPIHYYDIPYNHKDEWLYNYIEFGDQRLYRYKRGHNDERQYLTDFSIMIPTKIDDVFYFMPDADLSPNLHGIWRVNADGSGLEQLCNDFVVAYTIHGDYIYIKDDFYFGTVYRMKTDGSDKKLVSENTNFYDVNGDIIIMVRSVQKDAYTYFILDKYGIEHVFFNTNTSFSRSFIHDRYAYFVIEDKREMYRLDFETLEFEFFSKIK